MEQGSLIEPLSWDTDHFGMPIAQVADAGRSAQGVKAAYDSARARGIRCLYLLVPTDATATVHAAEDAGFRLTDVRVTFARDPSDELTRSAPSPLRIRDAVEADKEPLAAIARAVHTDTRFFADRVLPRERAHDLYAAWMRNSFSGLADSVDVVERDGAPVGYITWRSRHSEGSIGIVGVSAEARGLGAGGALVARAIERSKEAGHKRITVVTSGRNLSAMRMYERQGFQTSSVELWYHASPADAL